MDETDVFCWTSYGFAQWIDAIPSVATIHGVVGCEAATLLLVFTVLILALAARRDGQTARLTHNKIDRSGAATQLAINGEIIAAIVHELAQPLSAILSNAETAQLLIAQPNADPGELRETFADIRRDHNRAMLIVTRMRMLMHSGELRREPLNLNDVVSRTLGLIRHRAARLNVSIEAKLSDLPLTHADATHLEQALINLLLNAIDSLEDVSPPRRAIGIGTRVVEEEIELSVSDTGRGMSPEERAMAFDAFFTTKATGVGLGLSIVRTVVKAHGGDINVETSENEGTTFRLTLPVRRCNETQFA